MTYLFKKGKVTSIDKILNKSKTIYVSEFDVNVNAVVDKKYANSADFDLEIYSNKSLSIPKFIKLRRMLKESYKEYERQKQGV